MSCQVRFRVRFRVRPRVRLRARLGVLPLFTCWPALPCSGALSPASRVCEKSMSLGNYASGCLASRGPHICTPAADRVVASRRLLLSLARLNRPRLRSAGRCGSAAVSWGYTVHATLSRGMGAVRGRARGAAA